MQNKIEVVIADDNPNIRETLKDILIEKGYLVSAVRDSYELLAYLKGKSPHILILDLIMPGKNSLDILFAIKSISSNTKIIIYTGFQKYENSIYHKTVDKFLLKDDNPEKLLQAIIELT